MFLIPFLIVGTLATLLPIGHSQNSSTEYVLGSGDLLSCGRDNQGRGISLCSTTSAVLYRLTNEADSQHDYYMILLTVRAENQTVHTYVTEDFVNITFPNFAALGGDLIPSQGCYSGTSVPVGLTPFGGSPYFYVQTPNACTRSPVDLGTYVTFVMWHECAQNNCPFSSIFNDYTQFAVGVDVPEGYSVPFSFQSKVTEGEPSTCCLNDLLATSQVNWSQQTGPSMVAVQPPPPSWRILWPFILVGLIGIAIATPTIFMKLPRWMKSNTSILQRPQGIQALSIISIAIGGLMLVGASRGLIPSVFPNIAIVGHPILTLCAGLFSLATGIGLWNGRDWSWFFAILANITVVLTSTFFLFLSGPLALLFLGVILFSVYTLSYLFKQQTKDFFDIDRNPGMVSQKTGEQAN